MITTTHNSMYIYINEYNINGYKCPFNVNERPFNIEGWKNGKQTFVIFGNLLKSFGELLRGKGEGVTFKKKLEKRVIHALGNFPLVFTYYYITYIYLIAIVSYKPQSGPLLWG